MSFVDIRFPEDISYGSSGGPGYLTRIVTTEAGHEQRNAQWLGARARYNVAHGVRTREQLAELIAFFRARKGRAHGFRFKDWSDYQATGSVLGTGDGTRTRFALAKTYLSGGVAETCPLSKPVAGTLKPSVGGVLRTTGFSLDGGDVVFAAPPAPGAIVAIDCEFDVPVRFDTDTLSATLDAYGLSSWLDIPLIEIRL